LTGLVRSDLDALRARIASIENRRPLADGPDGTTRPGEGDTEAAGSDPFRVPAGLVHEIFADETRSAGAALGFALGLSRQQVMGERQGVLYLQLAGEAQETGLPYGLGLTRFGFDARQLVLGRIANVAEMLWALEEAIACRAVAAVVADFATQPKALDFTVSRRLGLRSAASGTSVLLLRYGREREASAARLRWRVAPAVSAGMPFDPQAPGPPRFRVGIEKRRLGGRSQRAEGQELLVEWTENGFVPIAPALEPALEPRHPAVRPRHGTALPRAVPAALGNRLSQAS
jgi:protein ImuA